MVTLFDGYPKPELMRADFDPFAALLHCAIREAHCNDFPLHAGVSIMCASMPNSAAERVRNRAIEVIVHGRAVYSPVKFIFSDT
jgi:hypothetical protein